MVCWRCGAQIVEGARFCSACGAAVQPVGSVPGYVPSAAYSGQLMRARAGRKIAGVCEGLARYINVDVMIVRIVALVLLFGGGFGFLAYIIAWIVIPEEPYALPPTV